MPISSLDSALAHPERSRQGVIHTSHGGLTRFGGGPRSAAVASVALAVALGIAGCAPAADAPSGNAASPPVSEEGGDSDDATADDDSGSEPAPAERDFASESLEQCLVGTWRVDDAQWRANLEQLVSSDLDAAAVTSRGSLILELGADQRYTMTGEDFTTVTTGASSGGDLTWTLTFNGPELGEWFLVSDIFILNRGGDSEMETSNVVEIDGQVADGSPTDPNSSPWSDDLALDCTEESLVTTPLNEPTPIPIVFTRVG